MSMKMNRLLYLKLYDFILKNLYHFHIIFKTSISIEKIILDYIPFENIHFFFFLYSV